MSVIAAHVSDTNLTFLVGLDDKGFSLVHFPFAYNSQLFGHFVTAEDFYTDIFQLVLKKYKLDPNACTILVCGSQGPVPLKLKTKINTSVFFLLQEAVESRILYINGMHSCSLKALEDDALSNFLSNKALVPSTEGFESSHRNFVYTTIEQNNEINNVPEATEAPIIVTGDIFMGDLTSEMYLLALNLLESSGIFVLQIDNKGVLMPLTLLSLHSKRLYRKALSEAPLTTVGTIFKTRNNVECLFETEVGTSQFFDIADDSLVIVPLKEADTAKVMLKNTLFKQVEGTVTGGSLGFIVDTRFEKRHAAVSGLLDDISHKHHNWAAPIEEALARL